MKTKTLALLILTALLGSGCAAYYVPDQYVYPAQVVSSPPTTTTTTTVTQQPAVVYVQPQVVYRPIYPFPYYNTYYYGYVYTPPVVYYGWYHRPHRR